MKIKAIIIATLTLAVWGCTDLEEEVFSVVPASQYGLTPHEIKTIAGGAYSTLRGGSEDGTNFYPTCEYVFFLDECVSDEACIPTRGSDWYDGGFALYNKLGVNAVKTGYVTHSKLDGKELHSSQYGVTHFRKVIEKAAKYNIMIDNHEPAMPTGLRRTYPNLMTQEGVRGQEFNAWSADGGNPPDHTTIVPFTRGLAGPMDFTFGTFNFDYNAAQIPVLGIPIFSGNGNIISNARIKHFCQSPISRNILNKIKFFPIFIIFW